MKTTFRAIAVLLCAVMILGMLPMGAFALETDKAAKSTNPYLPMWEHIPDGEPRIFTDPETGEDRLYIYGSHDSFSSTFRYCGVDHVAWSAPLDDLTDWRHEGELFNAASLNGIPYINQNGEEQVLSENSNRVLYAPDVIYYPDNETYYMFLFPNPENQIFVVTSKSPAGPFTDPQYVCDGFDPAALVDDEVDENGNHKVYLYYSTESGRDGFACQLDPENNMKAIPGTLHYPDTYKNNEDEDIAAKSTMLSKNLAPFHFFEGPSIRKVNGWYLLSYQRSAPTNPENTGNGKLAEIGWAYSKNPYGDPNYADAALADEWHYGGVIVSNLGERIANPYAEDPENPDYIDTFFGQNTHGGMVQINDQWYQIYHRGTNNGMKRQSMVAPFDMEFDPVDGHPIIAQVEMTSQGFYTEGLDPFASYPAAIACYEVGGSYPIVWGAWVFYSSYPVFTCTTDDNYDPDGVHGDWYPIQQIRHRTWLGYKYYNFGEGFDAGEKLALRLSLKEYGAGTVNVYANDPKANYEDTEKPKTLLGSAQFAGTDAEEHEIAIAVDAAKLSGKKGIYVEFLSADGSTETNLCELNKLQFVKMEDECAHNYVATTVNAPTCMQAGSSTFYCTKCGSSYNEAIDAPGHDFENGICTRCGSAFADIEPGVFYFDAVQWAVDNGITNGYAPGVFAPELAVTRANIVTMLWRAAGCPEPTAEASFSDLRAGAYYTKAVAWAVENGITNGTGKNKFEPESICTRGQIVTFLWRYLNKPAASAPAVFTDVASGAYYADAAAWAVEAGVTTGITEELFKPEDNCTRAQAVTFLQRTLAE